MVTVLWLLIVLKQNSGLLTKFSPVFSLFSQAKIVGSHVIECVKSNLYYSSVYLIITCVFKVA